MRSNAIRTLPQPSRPIAVEPTAVPPRGAPRASHTATLTRLFEDYHQSLLALFRRRGFSQGECEDLVQETFLKAHRCASDYRGDAPVQHWLFRIATNTAKARLRFRSAARRTADEVPLDRARHSHRDAFSVAADPLGNLLASERCERLLTAVDHLPARMRCCVRLLLEKDIRYREIASVLRISEQTVKVQMARARGQLRILLNEKGSPTPPTRFPKRL